MFEGRVERSLLLWAIFPDFYTKQALKVWRSPLRAVFYWNVKGKTRKKWKNTASFMASLGAGVQSNTGSKNPVDKKPLGKLLGAERIIKAVYYLGGISPNCAADDIVSFCRPYCNILDCRILSSKRTGTQAARLVIDKRTCSTLEKVEWPEHVFLQKWNFPVINATEGNPKGPAQKLV